MGAVLVIEVEATGERRRHPAGRLRLGRAADNDWALPDADPQPSLSRRHCVIEATAEGFAVTDLGSTNGTRLNGQPVPPHTPTPLAAGDRLQLGRHALRLAVEEERPDLAPPEATLLPPARPLPATASAPDPALVGLDALLGGLVARDPAPPRHLADQKTAHLKDLLGWLLGLLGEASSFAGGELRPVELPPYRHDRPDLAFRLLFQELRRLLVEPARSDRKAIRIPLKVYPSGVRAAEVQGRLLFAAATFVIAFNAPVSLEAIRQRLPGQIKIGPAENLQSIVRAAMPGTDPTSRW